MTNKAKRKAVILKSLSDLSRDGWANARPEDYKPLEKELESLREKERS